MTQGTVLAVTSNPDRTSPVKRGLFILDNILGSPPAPPPPNIPALEEAGKKVSGRTPTLRESMVLHRNEPTCAGCHARMDPLGLALENFNALGRWREQGAGRPDRRLRQADHGRAVRRRPRAEADPGRAAPREFYRCLTEKMLTYALGRGLEDHDVQAVDTIVAEIEARDGRGSTLIAGIIESAPFQKCRRSGAVDSAGLSAPASGRGSDPTN